MTYRDRTITRVTRRLWDQQRRDFVEHTFEVVFNPNVIPTRVYADALKSKHHSASRCYKAITVREEQP